MVNYQQRDAKYVLWQNFFFKPIVFFRILKAQPETQYFNMTFENVSVVKEVAVAVRLKQPMSLHKKTQIDKFIFHFVCTKKG